MHTLYSFILCYVDPGSTGFIVQIIIGAVVGVGFFFKSFWWRVKAIFQAIFSKKDKK